MIRKYDRVKETQWYSRGGSSSTIPTYNGVEDKPITVAEIMATRKEVISYGGQFLPPTYQKAGEWWQTDHSGSKPVRWWAGVPCERRARRFRPLVQWAAEKCAESIETFLAYERAMADAATGQRKIEEMFKKYPFLREAVEAGERLTEAAEKGTATREHDVAHTRAIARVPEEVWSEYCSIRRHVWDCNEDAPKWMQLAGYCHASARDYLAKAKETRTSR